MIEAVANRVMVSVVAAVTVVAVSVALVWFGWRGAIGGFLGGLETRINAAGYVCIGGLLSLARRAVVLVDGRQRGGSHIFRIVRI